MSPRPLHDSPNYGAAYMRKWTAENPERYAATRKRFLDGIVPLEPGDPRHGRDSSYVTYKCRCAECKDAHAAYARRLRAAKAGKL